MCAYDHTGQHRRSRHGGESSTSGFSKARGQSRSHLGIALETNDCAKRARNRLAARKAYDTFLRFVDRVAFTHDDSRWLMANLLRLKCNLEMLGETL